MFRFYDPKVGYEEASHRQWINRAAILGEVLERYLTVLSKAGVPSERMDRITTKNLNAFMGKETAGVVTTNSNCVQPLSKMTIKNIIKFMFNNDISVNVLGREYVVRLDYRFAKKQFRMEQAKLMKKKKDYEKAKLDVSKVKLRGYYVLKINLSKKKYTVAKRDTLSDVQFTVQKSLNWRKENRPGINVFKSLLKERKGYYVSFIADALCQRLDLVQKSTITTKDLNTRIMRSKTDNRLIGMVKQFNTDYRKKWVGHTKGKPESSEPVIVIQRFGSNISYRIAVPGSAGSPIYIRQENGLPKFIFPIEYYTRRHERFAEVIRALDEWWPGGCVANFGHSSFGLFVRRFNPLMFKDSLSGEVALKQLHYHSGGVIQSEKRWNHFYQVYYDNSSVVVTRRRTKPQRIFPRCHTYLLESVTDYHTRSATVSDLMREFSVDKFSAEMMLADFMHFVETKIPGRPFLTSEAGKNHRIKCHPEEEENIFEIY